MTTLDDAAERRIRELASSCARSDAAVENLIRTAWREATEAAAKKCEARRSGLEDNAIDRTWNRACDHCAAAIRGKP